MEMTTDAPLETKAEKKRNKNQDGTTSIWYLSSPREGPKNPYLKIKK